MWHYSSLSPVPLCPYTATDLPKIKRQSITYKEKITQFSWLSSILFYILYWLFHLEVWHCKLSVFQLFVYMYTLSSPFKISSTMLSKGSPHNPTFNPKLPQVPHNTPPEIPSDLLYSLFTHSPLQKTGVTRRYCGYGSRTPQQREFCNRANHTNFLVSQGT